MLIPIRNVHVELSTAAAHQCTPPFTAPSSNLPYNDTYNASRLLEDGPPPSGDSKSTVHDPLTTEELSPEESTPFLELEEDGYTVQAPTFLSRWLPRWKRQSRRNSYLYRKRTKPSSIQRAIQGQGLQYTLKRRPSLFRCTLYLLAATLMLL